MCNLRGKTNEKAEADPLQKKLMVSRRKGAGEMVAK